MQDVDLGTYQAANWPNDNTSTVGGAVDTDSPISDGVTGSLFPAVAIPVAGGSDTVHYYKFFKSNDSATETALTPRFWIYNGLKASTSKGPVTVITYASETGVVRVAGYVNGVADYEDINVTGPAGSYSGVKSFDIGEIWWAEALTVGGSRRAVAGKHEIWRSVSLGIIPGPVNTGTQSRSFTTATAEYDIGLDATKNGSTSTANRLTAPSGVTFQRPINYDEAVTGPDLSPGDAIGIWMKRKVRAGLTRPQGPVEPAVMMSVEV